MTEEYKKELLDYLTGELTPTSPTTDEIIKEIIELDKNKWTPYLPSSWYSFNFEGLIPANELTSNLTILYGGYVETSQPTTTSGKGIIILLNQDFEPVKTFYQYESGTQLRYIQQMQQADDGSFYMVDDTQYADMYATGPISQKRFVMLNNFTILNNVNEYVLQLRTSYIMQSPYNAFYCRYMTKNPNSAHYILAGHANDGNAYMQVIELKVNVGAANEWTLYNLTSTQQVIKTYCTAIGSFDSDDNIRFRLLYVDTNNVLSQMYKNYNSSTYSTASIYSSDINGFGYPFGQQFVFLTYNECYFVANNQVSGDATGYLRLYNYNFTTSTLTEIYNKNVGAGHTLKESMNLFVLNGELYIQFNNNIDNANYRADYYIQRLTNNVWNPILIAQNKGYVIGYRRIFARQTFNVLQVYLYPTAIGASGYQCLIKENYNSLNYNGESYVYYNVFKAKQGTIYSNGSLVFARNLYNQTIYNNVVNSTIAVPNSYLNDMMLTQNNLLSETNFTMITQNQTYTKNIYETLYLNFINTYNVINQDTNTSYPYAAAYVAENINEGTEPYYENGYVGKLRINTNSTPRYVSLTWEDVSDTIRKATATIYVTQEIISIDFMSDNETMVYNTIDGSALELGKYYNITQYLTIE